MECCQIRLLRQLDLLRDAYRLRFFMLYTNECRSTKNNCHVVKYADDTVFQSLLTSAECDDSKDRNEFFEWCKKAELS